MGWLVASAAHGPPLEGFVVRYLLEPGAREPRAGERAMPGLAPEVTWTASEDPVALRGVACAYARIESAAAEVRMARLTGGAVLFVNGEPFPGDPQRWGFQGVPVALQEGANELYVIDAPDGFELELWKPARRMVVGNWDFNWWAWTGVASGPWDLAVPLFNASTEEAEFVHFHYGRAVADPSARPFATQEWNDGFRIPPLGVRRALAMSVVRESLPAEAPRAYVPLEVYAGEAEEPARTCVFLQGPAADGWPVALPGRDGRGGGALRKVLTRADRPAESPLWLVHGTAGSDEEDAALLALARFDSLALEYGGKLAAEVWSDADFGTTYYPGGKWESLPERVTLVLYGNASSNLLWPAVLSGAQPALPPELAEPGPAAGWWWPEAPADNVVVAWASGPAGARFALVLRLLSLRPDAGGRRFVAPSAEGGLRIL